MGSLVLIVIIVLLGFLFYKIFKPYFLKYDTTILFCGGLGSGKSMNSVKTSLVLYRKSCLKVKWLNFKIAIHNKLKRDNKEFYVKPKLYSNIPIRIGKNKYSTELTLNNLTLKDRLVEYSVVFIDELPQVVNQFNWNLKEVQYNLNEFISYFRHYIGGYLICNGQAESEIVKQVRSKLNSYYWCFNFQKFLHFFYRVRILHSQITENEVSMSTEFIEDKTKWTYGIINKNYNSRAFRLRYFNIKNLERNNTYYKSDLTTNKILRFDKNYKSPCDDEVSK